VRNAHVPLLSSVASPSLQNVSTIFHKRRDFRETKLNITCVLIFSTVLCETFLTLKRIGRGMIKNVSCEVPVFLVKFLMKL
jgi:hypothetical protein